MRAIILAAGCGRRLRPYTANGPKCLLPFAGQSLLQRQLATLRRCGIDDVVVVAGYFADRIVEPGIRRYVNRDYERSNVVASLRCAERELDGDVVVWYGDVICDERVVRRLMAASRGDVVVAVDGDWRPYYRERFGDDGGTRPGWVVGDADRLLHTRHAFARGAAREVQYIGLIRFRPAGCTALRQWFQDADEGRMDDGAPRATPIRDAFMADLLEALIARTCPIHAVVSRRGWLEFDSVADYELAQRWHEEGSLERFIRL